MAKNKNLIQIEVRSILVCQFISEFMFESKKGKDKQFNVELFNTPIEFRRGINKTIRWLKGEHDDL